MLLNYSFGSLLKKLVYYMIDYIFFFFYNRLCVAFRRKKN